jgi:hypothetical protein
MEGLFDDIQCEAVLGNAELTTKILQNIRGVFPEDATHPAMGAIMRWIAAVIWTHGKALVVLDGVMNFLGTAGPMECLFQQLMFTMTVLESRPALMTSGSECVFQALAETVQWDSLVGHNAPGSGPGPRFTEFKFVRWLLSWLALNSTVEARAANPRDEVAMLQALCSVIRWVKLYLPTKLYLPADPAIVTGTFAGYLSTTAQCLVQLFDGGADVSELGVQCLEEASELVVVRCVAMHGTNPFGWQYTWCGRLVAVAAEVKEKQRARWTALRCGWIGAVVGCQVERDLAAAAAAMDAEAALQDAESDTKHCKLDSK